MRAPRGASIAFRWGAALPLPHSHRGHDMPSTSRFTVHRTLIGLSAATFALAVACSDATSPTRAPASDAAAGRRGGQGNNNNDNSNQGNRGPGNAGNKDQDNRGPGNQ